MSGCLWVIASFILALAITGLGWRLLVMGLRLAHAPVWMACLFAMQTGALCVESWQTGMCPVRGTAESLFFFSWALNLFYLILGRSYRISLLGIYTAPAVAALVLCSLTVGYGGAEVSAQGGFWVTAHVAVIMMAYGAGALGGIAGLAFLLQDARLKRRLIPGTGRQLPPIRTLETAMKRLNWLTFTLLLIGGSLSSLGHLSASAAKLGVVALLLLSYVFLLIKVAGYGVPGRSLAYWSVGLFILSISVYWVG